MDGKTKTVSVFGCLFAAVLCARTARAGFDTPASFSFEFVRDDAHVFGSFEEIPLGEMLSCSAYLNSGASSFGDTGALVWAGFRLPGSEPRFGILLLDLDLSRAPFDDETPFPPEALRAYYIEKWSDRLLFRGEALVAEVWLVDVFFSHDDQGSLELDVALMFSDASGEFAGSRALLQGRLVSIPSPQQVRQNYHLPPVGEGGEVYVDAGCSGDIYIADDAGEGCDCGGDDPDNGGCEGDTSGESGCEGDSYSSGCEGDSSSSAGCEGDSGGGCGDASGSSSCSGDSSGDCSTAPRKKHRRPLRFLPQALAMGLIIFLRRRKAG